MFHKLRKRKFIQKTTCTLNQTITVMWYTWRRFKQKIKGPLSLPHLSFLFTCKGLAITFYYARSDWLLSGHYFLVMTGHYEIFSRLDGSSELWLKLPARGRKGQKRWTKCNYIFKYLSCICYRRPRHVNWSQLKMGPLWDISKRSVWYSLQDKGDSANSGTQTYPKRYCQQRKALSILVCTIFLMQIFLSFCHCYLF